MSKIDVLHEPVLRALCELSASMIVEIIAIMSINIVDTYFIGQIGTAPLAAISFCFPAILTLTSFAIGLGPGTSSVVARAYGRSDKKRGLSVGYS